MSRASRPVILKIILEGFYSRIDDKGLLKRVSFPKNGKVNRKDIALLRPTAILCSRFPFIFMQSRHQGGTPWLYNRR